MTAGLPADFAARSSLAAHPRAQPAALAEHARPYRVWLSEIMLQQTQVATVLGYFARFLERFPDVKALAAGTRGRGVRPVERPGLLQPRAQHAPLRAGGGRAASAASFRAPPRNWQTLPGIGRSTAAAIAAFCFGERVAILDGNVKRVLTRVLAFGRHVVGRQERALWDLATQLLPPRRAARSHARYTQG
jgi:A/G-specific adenine glycosylase